MDAAPLTSRQIGRIFHDQIARAADDAAFLWVLRASAVKRPDYFPSDVAALDKRIDAHLDLLLTTSEAAWDICIAPSYRKEAGETFVLAALAFKSGEVGKIQEAVSVGLSNDAAFRGIVSAMGWLPPELTHPWQDKLLVSADPDHRYLAIAACSVRRDDPQQHLVAILKHEDCIAHPKLHARALRLAGELKRIELLPLVCAAMRSDQPEVKFWSHWSAVMLGDKSAAAEMKPFVFSDNPYRMRAIQLCFRALPMPTARIWLNELAKDATNVRLAILAAAALGDPITVEWLLGQMTIPSVARAAGEAFTTITGIDLSAHNLTLDKSLQPTIDDDSAEADEQHVSFPDVDKVAAFWSAQKNYFVFGQRYAMGDAVNNERTQFVYLHGRQRQRYAAALELALLEPSRLVSNAASPGGEL